MQNNECRALALAIMWHECYGSNNGNRAENSRLEIGFGFYLIYKLIHTKNTQNNS